MELVDEEGAEALTARRLAADLGISSRTLYKRIKNRDNLLTQVGALFVSQLKVAIRPGGSWDSTWLAWCIDLRHELMSRGQLCELFIDPVTSHMLESVEDLLDLAVAEGLSRRLAVDCCRTITTIAINDAVANIRTARSRSGPGTGGGAAEAAERDFQSSISLILDGVRARRAMANRTSHSWRQTADIERRGRKDLGNNMNQAQEVSLAWALAEVAKPYVTSDARAWTCTQIGAGDHDKAIRSLLDVLIRGGVTLPMEIATQLQSWLSGYTGSKSEIELREIVSQIPVTTGGEGRAVLRRPSRTATHTPPNGAQNA